MEVQTKGTGIRKRLWKGQWGTCEVFDVGRSTYLNWKRKYEKMMRIVF